MSSAIQRTVCASISVAAGESPQRADVRVDRRGEQVAEHADRRRRRRDVAEEARMAVEERVLKQEVDGLVQDGRGIAAGLGHTSAAEPRAESRRGLARVDAPRRQLLEETCQAIDEPVPERPKVSGSSSSGLVRTLPAEP